jgi:LysM domain-containing protein
MFACRWILLIAALVGVFLLVAARPSNGSAGEERYVVQRGDTLWALAAERYGGDPREGVWRIRERNDLDSAPLRTGIVLYLPVAGDGA